MVTAKIWYLILSSDGLMRSSGLDNLTTERQTQIQLTKLVRGHFDYHHYYYANTQKVRKRRISDIKKMRQLEDCYEVVEIHIEGFDLYKYGSHSARGFRNRRKSIPTQEKPLKENK